MVMPAEQMVQQVFDRYSDRPSFTDREVRDMHHALDRINGRKRDVGRARDSISHHDLDELIRYAQHQDKRVQEEAKKGLLAALAVAGTAVVVAAALVALRSLVVVARRALFATTMADSIRRSVRLITTVGDSLKPKLARDIWQLARASRQLDSKALQDLLVSDYGVTEQEAKVIALDQSRKFQGSLAESVQVAHGVELYLWETMKDDRVRPSHWAKQGRRFRWDSPPRDTGHPGDDINCRCRAVPVIGARNKMSRRDVDLYAQVVGLTRQFKSSV